jgi:hypothetical protein
MARGARGPNVATEPQHVSRIAHGAGVASLDRCGTIFPVMRLADWCAERSARGDAHARGRCLAARRAPGHRSADLVVGRRRRYRLCGHRDDVCGGSGPLHAPAPPTTLTLAAVNRAEAGFPNVGLRHDSDRSIPSLLLSRERASPATDDGHAGLGLELSPVGPALPARLLS